MITLNNVLGTLTGPRRLRSALRGKTAPITRLLVALDGPCELRATIPASVFGGDIFGVMSRQLREALIIPPPQNTTVPIPRRKQSLPSVENPLAQHSENVFPSLATRLKPSTLPSETTKSSLTPTTPFRNSEGSSLEPQARGASITKDLPRHLFGQAVPETPAVSRRQTIEPPAFPRSVPTARFAPTASALVNSLNRYWEHSQEVTNAVRRNEPVVGNQRANVPRNFSVLDVEQPGSSVWPSLATPNAFKRKAPFEGTTNSAAGRSLRSAQLNSCANQDFNLIPANDHAPHYDDLGDRLAQILHEQALQHGIDVT